MNNNQTTIIITATIATALGKIKWIGRNQNIQSKLI